MKKQTAIRRAVIGATVLTLLATGCSSQSDRPDIADQSPEAVFQAAKESFESKDYRAFAECFTPESQEVFAGGLVMTGSLFKAFGQMGSMFGPMNAEDGEAEEQNDFVAKIDAVFEKHGLSEEELGRLSPPADPADAMASLKTMGAAVDDPAVFIADMLQALESLEDAESEADAIMHGKLVDVTINGDTAKGFIETDTDDDGVRNPIEFKRIDGAWRIELNETLMTPDGSGADDAFDGGSSAVTFGGVAQGEPVANHSTETPAGLTLEAHAEWDRMQRTDVQGNPVPRNLVLVVTAHGDAAADASHFGLVEVDKVVTDQGASLTMAEAGFFEDLAEEMVKVARSGGFFGDHPEDGVRVALKFEHPDPRPEAVAELEGAFQIKTGGERKDILAAVPESGEETVESPLLTQIGVDEMKIGALQEDDMGMGSAVEVKVQGDLGGLLAVTIVDAGGKDISLGKGSFGGGRQMTYQVMVKEPLPDGAQVRATVVLGGDVITVPFAFEAIEIPESPGA